MRSLTSATYDPRLDDPRAPCSDAGCPRCRRHQTTAYPERQVIPAQWYPNRAARRAAGYVRGASSPGDMIVYARLD